MHRTILLHREPNAYSWRCRNRSDKQGENALTNRKAEYAHRVSYRARQRWLRVITVFLGFVGGVCILSSVTSVADSDVTGLSLYTGFFGIFVIVAAACFYLKRHEPPTT
jgi:hypothetical protein